MQNPAMSNTAASRTGVTVRLDPVDLQRLRQIAEAERVVHIHVAPELAGLPQGPVGREDGESDERYGRRKAVLTALFGECGSCRPLNSSPRAARG